MWNWYPSKIPFGLEIHQTIYVSKNMLRIFEQYNLSFRSKAQKYDSGLYFVMFFNDKTPSKIDVNTMRYMLYYMLWSRMKETYLVLSAQSVWSRLVSVRTRWYFLLYMIRWNIFSDAQRLNSDSTEPRRTAVLMSLDGYKRSIPLPFGAMAILKLLLNWLAKVPPNEKSRCIKLYASG